ncbi:MAG: hypothetical protein HUK22_04575 [Thermoguttaceae bacterium]|nr:hypothetical protein [Thermoguttaceae bacterium]
MLENIFAWEFPPQVKSSLNFLFYWSGYAIWIGLIANFFFSRWSSVARNVWTTFLLGIVGSTLGPLCLGLLAPEGQVDPAGPAGIFSAFVMAIVVMIVYALFVFFTSPNGASRVDARPPAPREPAARETLENHNSDERP